MGRLLGGWIVLVSWPLLAFQPPVETETCPFRLDRPQTRVVNAVNMQGLEDLLNAPEQDKELTAHLLKIKGLKKCVDAVSIDNAAKARQCIVDFNNKTLSPMPKNYEEESQKLARTLADLIVTAMFRMDQIIATGKINGEQPVSEAMMSTFVQLVRTLYSTDEYVRNVAKLSATIFETTTALPASLNKLRELINAEKALREDRFVDRTCRHLQAQYERMCTQLGKQPGDKLSTPLTADEQTALWRDVEAKITRFKTASNEALGKRTLWSHVTKPWKRTKVDAKNPFAVEEAYYDHAVPLLKVCGLSLLYDPSPALYNQACENFFCQESGLFHLPAYMRQDPNFRRDQFCEFMSPGGYRRMEARYKEGFQRAAASTERPAGDGASAFCPPHGADTLSRLPPLPRDHADEPSRRRR